MAFAAQAGESDALFEARLQDIKDKSIALAQYRGKPLIVNFWARWCAPCREEIPEFINLRDSHPGKFEMIGIGLEEDVVAVRQFAEKFKINYPLYLGREQAIPLMQALGNKRGGLPYTVVIDRQGRVIYSKTGLMRKIDLDQAAELALK